MLWKDMKSGTATTAASRRSARPSPSPATQFTSYFMLFLCSILLSVHLKKFYSKPRKPSWKPFSKEVSKTSFHTHALKLHYLCYFIFKSLQKEIYPWVVTGHILLLWISQWQVYKHDVPDGVLGSFPETGDGAMGSSSESHGVMKS